MVVRIMNDNTDDNPSLSTEQTPTDDGADLDRIRPSTVLDLYLDERKSDLADSTRRSHRYVIERFVDWCEENDVPTVADLDGRDLQEFRVSRALAPAPDRSCYSSIFGILPVNGFIWNGSQVDWRLSNSSGVQVSGRVS